MRWTVLAAFITAMVLLSWAIAPASADIAKTGIIAATPEQACQDHDPRGKSLPSGLHGTARKPSETIDQCVARIKASKPALPKQQSSNQQSFTTSSTVSGAAVPANQGWVGYNSVPYPGILQACESYYGNAVYGQSIGDGVWRWWYPSSPVMGLTVDTASYIPGYREDYDHTDGTVKLSTACNYKNLTNLTDNVKLIWGWIGSYYQCPSGTKQVRDTCLPLGYPVTAEKTCDKCNQTAGDPVSLSSGAKVETVTDYSTGGNHPITIARDYRSIQLAGGGNGTVPGDGNAFGLRWWPRILRGMIYRNYSNGHVYFHEDGTQTQFQPPATKSGSWSAVAIEAQADPKNSNLTYYPPQTDVTDKIQELTANQVYEVTDDSDRIDHFAENANGYFLLTQTRYRDGYQRTYTYDSNSQLQTISDNLGRSLSFSWSNGAISQINLPGGETLTYTYTFVQSDTIQVTGTALLTGVVHKKADGTVIDQTSYTYDTSGSFPVLTGVTDAKGIQIDTTTYDQYGRATSTVGAGGVNQTTISYDDVNNKRTVTNALGEVQVYSFTKRQGIFKLDRIDRQASATVPAASYQQTYDTNGFLAQTIDWNGNVTKYTSDSTGRETQRIEAYGTTAARTINTTWSTTYRVPTQIVGPNLTVNLTWDTSGHLTQRTETDTSVRNGPVRTWNFTWSAQGNLLTVDGPRTDVSDLTTYTYDANGYLASVKNALNQTTTITSVNNLGQPLSVTDPNGVITNLTYDGMGRLLSTTVQGPTPATTSFTYDPVGLLTQLQRSDGQTLTYSYDDARRLIGITDSLGNQVTYTLDAMGNRTQKQVKSGTAQVLKTQAATFDSLGRLLSNIGAANQTTAFQYDNNGNQVKVTDPRNAITQNAFDALDRLTQVTDGLNGITKYGYNSQDFLTSVTDPKNQATTYTYNGFGFATKLVSPDTGTTSFTVDLAGNVTSATDARGIVTNYTYDALNRPLTRSYPSSTSENVTFGYDSTANGNLGIGHLTLVTDAAGSASFTYNSYGNQTGESRIISGVTYNTSYAYDLANDLIEVTYPSGLIVDYSRDGLGRVSGVTMKANALASPVTLASNIQYLPFGAIQSVTLGNGLVRSFLYDQDYRRTKIVTDNGAGGNGRQNLTLSYDGMNNITGIADGLDGSRSQVLTYDLLEHLKQATGAYGSDSFNYDANGNRTSRTLINGTTTSSTYSYTTGKNQLASVTTGGTTRNFTYDAAGNETIEKLGTTTNLTYTYNANNRLSQAVKAGGQTTTYKYDAFGQRRSEVITGTTTTQYSYGSDGALLMESNSSAVAQASYIYLNGEPLAMIDVAGNLNYVLTDQVGQPQKMVDGTGLLIWDRIAMAFGETASQPVGVTAANPQRFLGQRADATTGLSYNFFRDYDPTLGRYIQSDPIGLRGGINTYAYTRGNPVRWIDPTGLATREPCDNVHHTCKLDNEQVLGGPMAGSSACNYECTDGQERSFIAETGNCPRFLSANDPRFKPAPWMNPRSSPTLPRIGPPSWLPLLFLPFLIGVPA